MDLAHTAAVTLDRQGLVKYDRRSGALQVGQGAGMGACGEVGCRWGTA